MHPTILLLMMNSGRAGPTPDSGICANSKASCGLPMFIMILIGRYGIAALCTSPTLGLEQSVVDEAGVALGCRDTVTRAPSVLHLSGRIAAAHHRQECRARGRWSPRRGIRRRGW